MAGQRFELYNLLHNFNGQAAHDEELFGISTGAVHRSNASKAVQRTNKGWTSGRNVQNGDMAHTKAKHQHVCQLETSYCFRQSQYYLRMDILFMYLRFPGLFGSPVLTSLHG